jgi:hypothetical protein
MGSETVPLEMTKRRYTVTLLIVVNHSPRVALIPAALAPSAFVQINSVMESRNVKMEMMRLLFGATLNKI